jgi:hypothetical protein
MVFRQGIGAVGLISASDQSRRIRKKLPENVLSSDKTPRMPPVE